MAFDPVSAVLEIGSKVIDRLWPDPAQRDAAKIKLFELQQSGELAVITAQTSINQVEAASTSVFVSGWRPFVGWVCGFGLVYSFVGQPLLSWGSINFGIVIPPQLDLGTLLTVLGGMLGLGTLRTTEKIKGVARE